MLAPAAMRCEAARAPVLLLAGASARGHPPGGGWQAAVAGAAAGDVAGERGVEHRTDGVDARLGAVVDGGGRVVAQVAEGGAEVAMGGRVLSSGPRRRQRQTVRRPHRLTPRF